MLLTTGSAIYVDDNSGSSGSRKLVHILADHADAGGTALHVESDGMESSKFKQNKASIKMQLMLIQRSRYNTCMVTLTMQQHQHQKH